MNDINITLRFNEHRLEKLESHLLKKGSCVEDELQNLLDRFYEQTVPDHERIEIEKKIASEQAEESARRETDRRFAVVHFHEGDDDYFFTAKLRNSFYSIANLYCATVSQICIAPHSRTKLENIRWTVLRKVISAEANSSAT